MRSCWEWRKWKGWRERELPRRKRRWKKNLKYIHICEHCGKSYKTNYSWSKFCGAKCVLKENIIKERKYWQRYYSNNKEKILIKNTKWYKDHFVPAVRKPPKGRAPYIYAPVLEKICKKCGDPFLTKFPNVKYCDLHRNSRETIQLEERECICCGHVFWAIENNQLLCSNPDCYKQYKDYLKRLKRKLIH